MSTVKLKLEGTDLEAPAKRMVTAVAKAKAALAEAEEAYNDDPVVIAYQKAQADLKAARDRLYLWMTENNVQQVKHAGLTCFETTRHDYVIQNESRFRKALENLGILATYIKWDMEKIKKMASAHRKETGGEDFPGIASVEKSFLEVR